mmetsp:Transcript_9832/g.37056  ORF Transcript_9832/g.37056 Transcript_9832/m.37056 type:complete len:276 (+) Transcript_9832:4938-5765(+)
MRHREPDHAMELWVERLPYDRCGRAVSPTGDPHVRIGGEGPVRSRETLGLHDVAVQEERNRRAEAMLGSQVREAYNLPGVCVGDFDGARRAGKEPADEDFVLPCGFVLSGEVDYGSSLGGHVMAHPQRNDFPVVDEPLGLLHGHVGLAHDIIAQGRGHEGSCEFRVLLVVNDLLGPAHHEALHAPPIAHDHAHPDLHRKGDLPLDIVKILLVAVAAGAGQPPDGQIRRVLVPFELQPELHALDDRQLDVQERSQGDGALSLRRPDVSQRRVRLQG